MQIMEMRKISTSWESNPDFADVKLVTQSLYSWSHATYPSAQFSNLNTQKYNRILKDVLKKSHHLSR
jgi:hypothetical protein